ncbi:transglutaminase-like cysteine peptidase [Pseudemcibacter aquimaris]|uniref:transglutaminase-like cysteine peptidase n=1 Tax=Pseudemcibacter aquimaris TaxID=2857064 RepID=UPI002011F186|nr:transglutaminase-like cysteine peptidase [Pseudemcibacter aquimaris]MCC3861912.1 transglutaminase-like cysteine peptidase [Pseudemcibacter aquimaris]WDU58664.1 transglutaminase-like cysteine peptidase [Pseudemcibacter aquimaris]
MNGKLLKTILVVCLYTIMTPLNSHGKPSLFGSTENEYSDLSAFKQWNDLRARHTKEESYRKSSFKRVNKHNCRMSKKFRCVSDEWTVLINELRNKPVQEQLDGVNKFFNDITYVSDEKNWKEEDYWATPDQFLNNAGDCEDFAIAKYFSLKELGFSANDLRIVVLQDQKQNLPHAVLAVYHNGKVWILDNQIQKVIPDDRIVHYNPLYSINENAWWLHKKS